MTMREMLKLYRDTKVISDRIHEQLVGALREERRDAYRAGCRDTKAQAQALLANLYIEGID